MPDKHSTGSERPQATERPQWVRMKNHEEMDDLRFALIEGKVLSGEIYGRLVAALNQPGVTTKERLEVQGQYQELQSTLTRILTLINSDMRGINNAKQDFLESKIVELSQILPRDKRIALLQMMLEKEQLELCRTTNQSL